MAVASTDEGRSASGQSVKIYTLGRFAVQVDGAPLTFGPKGPRKPLALLKALVAAGGQGVLAEPLIHSLWPDLDGDHAQRAYRTALYRLRRLLGREAVLLSGARLTLNPGRCWVDTQALLENLEATRAALRTADSEAAWQAASAAQALYRGPFLDGEFDPPEIQTARDRLEQAFQRQLSETVEVLMRTEQPERARVLHGTGFSAQTLTGRAPFADAPPADPRGVDDWRRTAVLPLPDEPSLAVLPFADYGADPVQAVAAEAIGETLITDLSRLRNLFVIAHHTMRAFTDPAVDPREVARELGVRHVLQGSVQSDAKFLRIAVRLSDTVTGAQVWAERYDRPRDDLFAVQDEIALRVVTEMEVQLTEGEQARSRARQTCSLDAYLLNARAQTHFRRFHRTENELARTLLEQALELDPDYPDGVAQLAWSYWADARYGWCDDREGALAHCEALARRAMTLDPVPGKGATVLGYVFLQRGQHQAALEHLRGLVQETPNRADARALLANALLSSGHAEQAIAQIKHAMRLCPYYPVWHAGVLGEACRLAGRHEEALAAFRHVLAREPDDVTVSRPRLVVLLAETGRPDEARAVAREILTIEPQFSLRGYGASRLYRDPAITEHMLALLRQAGLPD